jgi:hypothetical protein
MRPALLAFVLSGCATAAEMAAHPPDRSYRSERSREAVAECLLDRMSDAELLPVRQDVGNVTTLAFESGGGLARPRPVVYLFTIRGEANGSVTEARLLGRPSLIIAETCF